MATTRILALDPATKCGFAHSCGASGTWDLSVRRDESSGMRLIRLVSKLNKIAEEVGVDIVVFEAARHAAPGMQGALVCHAELQGQIKVWCDRLTIQYRGYSPTEIKKHATGKGNANKEKMIVAARDKWPHKGIVDDNECDALWLLDLAASELSPAPAGK
jgi:Holliday junction resolvasome RuvABC endonuclease subunit